MRYPQFRQQNKYRAIKTYSELCGQRFDSKAEAKRGEELALLQKAGEIGDLQYQVRFVLHQKPIIAVKIDFCYKQDGKTILEDVKGMGEQRDFRVKRYWLEEKYGVQVLLTK